MKEIIKYHNNFAEAIYKLDVVAKKILLAVILHKNDGNKIEIHRSAFKELVGIDPSQSHQATEKAIEDLMTTIITIRDIEKPSNWEKYQLLKATKYEDGVLYTSIYEDLLPYFDEAQKRLFTKYNIQNIKPLKSEYSIKMYELLKQYQTIGKRTFEVEELRNLLDCTDKYKYFRDFRKFTIDVAKKELSAKTDIAFDYDIEKYGRTPKKVHFKIWTNINTEAGQKAIAEQMSTSGEKDAEKEMKNYYKSNIKLDDGTIGELVSVTKDIEHWYHLELKLKTSKGTADIKVSQSAEVTRDWLKTHIFY